MNVLKEFHISFTGLKDELHSFNFEIGKEFFDAFEDSRIHDSKIQLELLLNKQETMLQLEFDIQGEAQVECDRCTGLFWQEVESHEKLIVKFGPETFEEAENILVLSDSEHEVKIEQYIYEFISLSLPMKLVHPDNEDGESGCDDDYLESYENESIVEDEEAIDPRWAALKNLKKD